MDQARHATKVLGLAWDLRDLLLKTGDAAERAKAFEGVQGALLGMNKCPDFVVNRGHYFGTNQMPGSPGLNDRDKEALIAFLKTF